MSKIKDIKGLVINMLSVIERTSSKAIDGSYLWLCECSCGNTVLLTHTQLVTKNQISCGCYKITNSRKFNTYTYFPKLGYIKVYDSRGNFTIIDPECLKLVKDKYWLSNKAGYFFSVTGSKNKPIQLHNFIFGSVPSGFEIDHKNRKKHDNRKRNLRLSTRGQNNINHGLSKSNTSGYVGVSRFNNTNRFRAYITYNNKQISLGVHDSKELAYQARLLAEKKYFGSFTSLKGCD
jgi:hypothetical protein